MSRVAVATVLLKSDCHWQSFAIFSVYSVNQGTSSYIRSLRISYGNAGQCLRHYVECHGGSGEKKLLLTNIIARIADDSDAAALHPQYKMSYCELCVWRQIGVGNKWTFLITREPLVEFR